MRNMNDEPDLLKLSIPTDDPHAFRIRLTKSLARSMRNYIIAHDDRDDQLALVELLESMLPKEPDDMRSN